MHFKEEIMISALPDKIFNKYTDVAGWKHWDFDIKESKLSGNFKKGSSGFLVPVKGPKSKFELTEVTLNKSFTSRAKLPLCTMDFTHTLEFNGDYVNVVHSVFFKGLTSFIFGRLIGHSIKKSLPITLENLKKSCE